MLLFLVRHAHAEQGTYDELRELSERGREEARVLGEQLSAHTTPPRLVITSPLLRARQTAEIVANAIGVEVRVEELLAPGATADRLRKAIGRADGPVAAIAHQPDCSEIARELTGSDPGFPTGGFAEITLAYSGGLRARATRRRSKP